MSYTKRALASLALVVVAAAVVATADTVSADDYRNSIAKALPSIVSVLPDWPADIKRPAEPEGSGVAIADGRTILTASHVIGRAKTVQVRTPDGTVVDARIAARDPFTDIALLTIGRELPALEFAGDAAMGQPVCALGHPFGFGLSVSCGIVSGVHKAGAGFNAIEDFVQTDAAVNPGMSGGALINAEGALVGLISAIFTAGADGNLGVNFAISAPLVQRVITDLMAHGRVQRVVTGLRLGPAIRKGEAGRLAARVLNVKAGSHGERAGLRNGDLIVRARGRRIHKPADFTSVIGRMKNGDQLDVDIVRGNKQMSLVIRFGQPATAQ